MSRRPPAAPWCARSWPYTSRPTRPRTADLPCFEHNAQLTERLAQTVASVQPNASVALQVGDPVQQLGERNPDNQLPHGRPDAVTRTEPQAQVAAGAGAFRAAQR